MEAEGLGKEVMFTTQGIDGCGWPQILRTLKLRQQQSICECLRIRIGELRIVRLGEQEIAPTHSRAL